MASFLRPSPPPGHWEVAPFVGWGMRLLVKDVPQTSDSEEASQQKYVNDDTRVPVAFLGHCLGVRRCAKSFRGIVPCTLHSQPP